MPKVGDRVIVDGAKVGAARREGSLVSVAGSLMTVRWEDGSTSMFSPGAGVVTFRPKGSGSAGRTARTKAGAEGRTATGATKAARTKKTAKKKA